MITRNKYLIFLFLEENDPISAKSATQTLSLILAKILHLFNILIAGLCNSTARFSHSLLILSYSQNIYRPYLLMPFDIHHV